MLCYYHLSGRKSREPALRQALFDWFVEVRCSLKGPLSYTLFRAKAQQLYVEMGCSDELKFSDKWIARWAQDFNISLQTPNKRFSLPKDVRQRRVIQLLKNVLRVRWYYKHVLGKDIEVLNMDQMPLHRNETAKSKTLNFKNTDCVVKTNHHLTRERVTCMTMVSSDEGLKPPHFVFKGKGTYLQHTLKRPDGVKTFWAEKGSYRLKTMLDTIKELPDLTKQDSVPGQTFKAYKICLLDDYSVHLNPDVS